MTSSADQIVGQIKNLDLGESAINYNNCHDRERALHRDPFQEPGQELAIISYIEGEAGLFMVRACVKDDAAVIAHLTESNKRRERLGLPVIKSSAPVPTGVWMSWPPKSEYMTKKVTYQPSEIENNDGTREIETNTVVCGDKPAVDVQQQNIDTILRRHYTGKAKAKKAMLHKIAKQSGVDYEDISDMLTPEEKEFLKNLRV